MSLDELRRRITELVDRGALARADAETLFASVDTATAEHREEIAKLTHHLDVARTTQRQVEARVSRIENSVVFRTLRWAGRTALLARRRAGRRILHSPLHPLAVRLTGRAQTPGYAEWIQTEQRGLPSREELVRAASEWTYQPLISILLPVHDPQPEWLDAAVKSVLAQTYPHWQLSISDDASQDKQVREYGRDAAARDGRIRYSASTEPGG